MNPPRKPAPLQFPHRISFLPRFPHNQHNLCYLSAAFSKRRQGLFKKAQELHRLTGAEIAILVFSASGRPYTHGEPSFEATAERYLKTVAGEDNNYPEGSGGVQISEPSPSVESILELGSSGGAHMSKAPSPPGSILDLGAGEIENLEQLMQLKHALEEIKEKTKKRIEEEEFVNSLFS